MHARVSTYEGRTDDLVNAFDPATGAIQRLDGFCKAYFLIDRAGGRGMSITFWESEDALNVSAERAAEIRARASDQAGATLESVGHFEVALTVG